jgi:hypothetical protein
MIPISFVWDTRKRSVYIKWNGFFSLGWEKGKVLKKMFGLTIPIPVSTASGKIRSPNMRWVYLKEALSFLKEWELGKVEGSLSFPDPMINGLLYGWLSAIETEKVGQKINMSINFVGENWCSGEATVPPKALFYRLRKWIFPLLKEIWGAAQKHH